MVDAHAHCPHCRQLLLADAPFPFPERPVRCSGCRLLVGPGRSRDARGRARRAPVGAALGGAPLQTDAVLTVLRELDAHTAAVELQAAGTALADHR